MLPMEPMDLTVPAAQRAVLAVERGGVAAGTLSAESRRRR